MAMGLAGRPKPRSAQIVGWGMAIPEKVVTNHDLEKVMDTTDEWIRSRTGIAQRHIASGPRETTASLAVLAGREALSIADVPASALNLIICATCTPEYVFPATACIVQNALGVSVRALSTSARPAPASSMACLWLAERFLPATPTTSWSLDRKRCRAW